MRQCVEKGLVSGRLAVTDSTHVKANASRASEQEVDALEEAGNYWERLDAYTVVQEHFSRRWEPEYQEALKQRQIWCEGTFAAQKWGHNLTRLLRRGLEAAEDHCLLSAAALNLKRMIKHSV